MNAKRKNIIKAIAARPLASRFNKWSDIFPPLLNESRESFAERAFLWGALIATHQFAGPWEPIATAPRDGTTILVRFGEDHVCEASYIATRPAYPWQFIDVKDLGWIVNYAIDGAGGPSHWRSKSPEMGVAA